jgi:hypothetical protein
VRHHGLALRATNAGHARQLSARASNPRLFKSCFLAWIKRKPEITPLDRYPLNVNDETASNRIAVAFRGYFSSDPRTGRRSRSFTPAQPARPAASVSDFVSGAYAAAESSPIEPRSDSQAPLSPGRRTLGVCIKRIE